MINEILLEHEKLLVWLGNVEDTQETRNFTFKKRLYNFTISTHWRVLRAKITWVSGLTLYFFTISYYIMIGPLFGIIVPINILTTFSISLIISIILIRVFTHIGKRFHPERAFQGKKDILMLKISKFKKNLNILESKQDSGSYTDRLIISRLKSIKLIKLNAVYCEFCGGEQ